MKKKDSKKIDALNDALNIADEIIKEEKDNQEIVPKDKEIREFEAFPKKEAEHKIQIQEDYELVRSTLRGLLTKGEVALCEMVSIVTESPAPRFIEVTGSLIKNIADVGKTLIDLHKNKQILDNPKDKNKHPQLSPPKKQESKGDTNYFIGTTAEFNAALEKDKKNKKK